MSNRKAALLGVAIGAVAFFTVQTASGATEISVMIYNPPLEIGTTASTPDNLQPSIDGKRIQGN